MDISDQAGCGAGGHRLDYVPFRKADRAAVDAILKKGLAGDAVTVEEAECFKAALLLFCAGQDVKRGSAMQIHYNRMRNPNSVMFEKLGPDSRGFLNYTRHTYFRRILCEIIGS